MPRIGIIGAGGMGRTHANGYSQISNATLIGIADTNAERGQALAEKHNVPAFPSIGALIEAERPDIIDICVPTPNHIAVAQEALAARIPTIIEKPMARTYAEAKKLVEDYRAAGVPILPAQVVRFFPDFFMARECIRDGAVGKPAVVRVTRGGPFPRGTDDWYGDAARSGGVLLDLMIHDFDWLRWTFGDVERVTASGLMAQGATDRDYALVVMRFKSGVIAHVEGTWVHTDGFRTELEVSGDTGVLEHTSQFPFAYRLRQEEAETRVAVPIPESPVSINPYTAELAELLGALTEGKPARVTAEDGMAAVEISEACWRSAQTGKPVTLPLET